MAKTKWKAFPHADKTYTYAGDALEKHWERLHAGDREPFPSVAWLKARIAAHPKLKPAGTPEACAEQLQDAWRAYHRGEFGMAAQQGEALGLIGANVAAKALNIYATYLVEDREEKLRLFQDAARKAEALQKAAPDDANAFYLHAQALGLPNHERLANRTRRPNAAPRWRHPLHPDHPRPRLCPSLEHRPALLVSGNG